MTSLSARGSLLPVIGALAAVTLAACGGNVKYVAVAVTSGPGVTALAVDTLHVTMTVGTRPSVQDITVEAGSLPMFFDFGGIIPANLTGSLVVAVEAREGTVAVAAGVSAATPLSAHGNTSVTVTLLRSAPQNCGDCNIDTADGEECDDCDGNNADDRDCTSICTINVCGDLRLHATQEQCDDGNTTPGDGCDENCVIEAPVTCGDGTLDPPLEECDDGAAGNSNTIPDACRTNCQLPSCGDGVTDTGEQCDDANFIPGDGCDAACLLEAVCGDGMVGGTEECDDANPVNSDACLTTCLFAFCGDGYLQTGVEACEDPDPSNNLDGCFADCTTLTPTPAVGFLNDEYASATVHGSNFYDNLAFRYDYQMTRSPIASGDFNGDGVADLLVGDPYADGPADVRYECGEAHVVFGGDHVPGAQWDVAGSDFPVVDLTIYGRGTSEYLGASVAAGDVNGDGIDDIVVGAPLHDKTGVIDAGEVDVILGSATLGGTIDLTVDAAYLQILGKDSGDWLGYLVAVSNDVAPVLAMGVPYGDGPLNSRMDGGEAYLLVAPAGGTRDLAAAPPDFTFYGADAFDHFGTGATGGDFNGDGLGDLFLSAPNANGPSNARSGCGEVYGFFQPFGAVQDVAVNDHDVIIYGAGFFDNLGALAAADFNFDGYTDIVAGAPGNAGRVIVVAGRTWFSPPPLVVDTATAAPEIVFNGVFNPTSGPSYLGREVTVADVDGNGTPDVIAAAENWPNPVGGFGAVFGLLNPFVSLGSSTTYRLDTAMPGFPPDLTMLPPPSDSTPLGVAGIGDFNHDGFFDLAVAGPYLDSGAMGSRPDGGRVIVYTPGPGALVPPGACYDGADNDGDGYVDFADAGCTSLSDPSEYLGTQCDDAADNDGDGRVDYPTEPGCTSIADDDETDPPMPPVCADGVDNDGDGNVDWPFDPSCGSASQQDESCNLFGVDSFGNFGCQQTVPVTMLPCPDISTTGTFISLGDDSFSSVPIGFSFDFYGTVYTDVNVGSNGKLFTGSAVYTNTCIPTGEGAAFYPWWDDLYPPGAGTVRYATSGAAPNRTFEVQWVVPPCCTSGPETIDVRVMLNETTNRIDVCYFDTTLGPGQDNGLSATIGMQDGAGSSMQFSCDAAVVAPGLLLHYNHP
ncbi:MAG TPA: DUF4215 domain-containing protein [Myxococcota bacterium]|jgi:cysteine-rich repeat protein|nr:DUF4215 domain-containing protein [Myxococcota bacterium]